MNATGLPARILYAVLAFPAACLGGFYLSILVETKLVPLSQGAHGYQAGFVEFVTAIAVGGALGFMAALVFLTLPWKRRRRRRGRGWRAVISGAMVFVLTVAIQEQGIRLRYVVGLAVWVAVSLTFTFIRYGLVDRPRREYPLPPYLSPKVLRIKDLSLDRYAGVCGCFDEISF